MVLARGETEALDATECSRRSTQLLWGCRGTRGRKDEEEEGNPQSLAQRDCTVISGGISSEAKHMMNRL